MRIPVIALAFVTAAVALTGCGGGDDGLRDGAGAFETPAQVAPPAHDVAPPPDGGLLDPRPKPKRAKRERKEARGERRERGRDKPRQHVAGTQRESASADSGSPLGSVGRPEADARTPSAPEPLPSLSAQQRAELESVRATLRELFVRLNARDASLCTELFTQRHVEEATGLTGDAAIARCREDVVASQASYALNKISGVRIEADTALIRFASSVGNYARWEIFRAQRHGSGWRFDGDGSADV